MKTQEIVQLLLNNLQLNYNALDMCASAPGKKLEQELNEAQKEVKGYEDPHPLGNS